MEEKVLQIVYMVDFTKSGKELNMKDCETMLDIFNLLYLSS